MNSLSSQAAQAAPQQSRLQSALDSLHSEVSYLEEVARILEQKLLSVLEPDTTKDTQGSTAVPPMPSQIVGIVGMAESRVSSLRCRIANLLDRLHV